MSPHPTTTDQKSSDESFELEELLELLSEFDWDKLLELLSEFDSEDEFVLLIEPAVEEFGAI